MSIGFVFWLIMLLWIISWAMGTWGGAQFPWAGPAGSLIFFILLFLLGWHAFGFIIRADLESPFRFANAVLRLSV